MGNGIHRQLGPHAQSLLQVRLAGLPWTSLAAQRGGHGAPLVPGSPQTSCTGHSRVATLDAVADAIVFDWEMMN